MTTTAEPARALIEDHHRRYAPGYQGGLSDHGAMAVLAMQGLGLPLAQIRKFHAHYLSRLEPAETAGPRLDVADYPGAVGRRVAYPSLLAFFADEITHHGARNTVDRYLPELLSGWANAAFHPIIRLGYGLEFDVVGEVAAGLAYAACLGPHPDLAARAAECRTRPPVDPVDAARALTAPPALDAGDRLFQPRLTRALQAGLLDPIGPPSGGLAALAVACREIFAATHDFFALHLVTGTHALRVCLGYLQRPAPEAESLAICGVMAAYLAVGAPEFSRTAAAERDDPAFDTRAYLAGTVDEHDVKLAYSAAAQARAYDDPTYLAAARGYLAQRARRSQ